MTDPDMGTWSYGYDANGNLTRQTDARGYTINFQYDKLNRLTLKDYPEGTDVSYHYDRDSSGAFVTDGKGRLLYVDDASGRSQFTYNAYGEVIATTKTVGGTAYTYGQSLNAMGKLRSVTYPGTGGEVVNYHYDAGGFLDVVRSATTTYATYSGYNALGQIGSILYGDNAQTDYSYDPTTHRLEELATSKGGAYIQQLSYEYDNVGNIRFITDVCQRQGVNYGQEFQYDHLNRLKIAFHTSYPGGRIDYDYDKNGNMIYNSLVGTYTYSTTNKPHAVRTAGSMTYDYDLNGNMTSRNGEAIAYNYDNLPSSISRSGVTLASFVYDYAGKRVTKTAGTNTTLYIGDIYECKGGVCTKSLLSGYN